MMKRQLLGALALLVLLANSYTVLAQRAPVFELPEYHREIREDTPVDTSFVRLTATDEDGDSVTYSLVNATSNNFVQASRIFRVVAATGEIRTAASLDAEVDRFFIVWIRAQDSSAFRLSAAVQLTVVIQDVDDSRPIITVLDRQIVFTDGQRPNIVNGFPVDLTRTVKVTDADTDFHGLRRFDSSLRSVTRVRCVCFHYCR